jgi:hypothetical protein
VIEALAVAAAGSAHDWELRAVWDRRARWSTLEERQAAAGLVIALLEIERDIMLRESGEILRWLDGGRGQ